MIDASGYDEFGLFRENADEAGLAWNGPPTVERVETALDDGRSLSGLRWGTDAPEVVLIHGGGQNAHTWDTVALALGRPLLAVDLPGHGHSGDVHPERPPSPQSLAIDVAEAIAVQAPEAALVVGMSLGGLTSVQVAARRPELVRKLMMVDVTPGAGGEKTADIVKFLSGPETFASLDEILERTIAFNPTRSESSLRRGVLHNTVQRPDGAWVWRHQRDRPALPETDGDRPRVDFAAMWDDIGAITVPLQLIVGDRSPVVDEADKAEFARRAPDAPIIEVADAGHSIQGDQPIELARLIDAFLAD